MNSSVDSPRDATRVVVVGLGSAGTTLHLPALAGIKGARVVGVSDVDEKKRSATAARFGVPVFEQLGDMLASTSPDVVVIATPPSSHADYCVQALNAGAHVLCEKPFVSSLAEADRVIAAAHAVNRRVALNHEFREMPIFRGLRERVRPQDVTFTQVWQLMDLPPASEPGWRGQLLQRTLFEAGVHLVDFLMALYAERPVAVSATATASGSAAGAGDAIVLLTLEFSRGRIAQIVQNRLCRGERQYFEVRAETAEASWRASFGGRARVTAGLHRSPKPAVRLEFGVSGLAWREVGSRRTVFARNPKDPGMLATRYVLERSLKSFSDGSKLLTSAADARDVLAVTAAAYASAAAGRRIELTDATLAELSSMHMGSAPPTVSRA